MTQTYLLSILGQIVNNGTSEIVQLLLYSNRQLSSLSFSTYFIYFGEKKTVVNKNCIFNEKGYFIFLFSTTTKISTWTGTRTHINGHIYGFLTNIESISDRNLNIP